ncbi:MAG: TonB-dependent receptor [Salinivirgaceae bacterium]|nr:TonB-dependent receptor [Salinivirgaceae bacterium]
MKKTLLILLTFFLFTNAFSQPVITGMVLDENGISMPGVSVLIKGTSIGTITDFNGKFSIKIDHKDAVLVFSFIGYSSSEITVGNQTSINIKMVPDMVGLDEVVIVGYGSQKKVSVVGAISTITTKGLVQSPAANISNALAGRLTGLTTVQNTGQPGKDDASLYIRGRSTWVNASPLYIVDGVERESYTQVDANEIEYFSILKDASATAVYGVRGANGVIIITTKRGKEQKPEVSLSAQYGLQQPTRLPNYLQSYETALLRNESFINDGYTDDQLPFQPAALEAFRTHSDPYHYPDVDWYDEVIRKFSPQSQYNVNIKGGTKTARYFLSTGYLNQEGLFNTQKHNDYNTNFRYDRFNFRSNLDIDVSKDLTFSVTIAARLEDTNEPGSTGYSGAENQASFAPLTRTPPYETPIFQKNGKPGVGPSGANPWLSVNGYGYTRNKKDVVESLVNLNYKLDKLTKGLSAKALLSYDSYFIEQKRYSKKTATYRLDSGPDEEDSYTVFGEDTELKYDGGYISDFSKSYFEGSLNYSQSFGIHNVTGLLLGNMESKSYGDDIPYRNMGLVSRLTYDYADSYIAEFNMGYNGSENFARGKRFGLFPSLSVGWIISHGNLLDKLPFINFMKLRMSYGLVGNDKIGGDRFMYSEEYSYRDSWVSPSRPYFGTSATESQIVTLSRIANPDLTWEKANKFNFGLETNFWENKLNTSVDVFLEYRKDILMDRNSIPRYLGVKPPAGNIGKTRNSGCEVEIKYRDKIGEDFNFWVNVNYSFAKNIIIYKDEPENKLQWQKEEGQSIGQFYGYKVLGFFDIADFDENGVLNEKYPLQLVGEAPKPGDFIYADINGDKVVDDRDKLPIGYSDIPESTIGFSYGFDWKGFDFSMMWQAAYHVSLNISSESLYEFCEGGRVQDFHKGRWAYYTDPFTGELVDTRATATYPRLHSQSSSPNWTINDFFLYNSSYLKLRNIEIGYELPIKQLAVLGISKMRVYLNGNNLLTFSEVKQVDPEGPGYGGNRERGWNYPQLAIYNLGINVTF